VYNPVVLRGPLTVATVAIVLAGCGGGGSNTSTNGAAASAGKPGDPAYAFARCMRDHGVTDFPDPVVHQSGGHTSVMIRVKAALASEPSFASAQKACKSILPGPSGANPGQSAAQRQAQLADMLSFARCMRGQGLNRFPDPTGQGHLSVQMVVANGIDVHSPAVLKAIAACLPATHGALTPAKVRAALAEVP
jgi:hypothetical protein